MDQKPILDQEQHIVDGAIQAGAVVHGSDGAEVGSIIAVSSDAMTVRKKGLFGGQVEIPRSLVREAEAGHVELQVPAKEVGRR